MVKTIDISTFIEGGNNVTQNEFKMLAWLKNHAGENYGNFINGQWSNSLSKETYPIFAVANQELLLGNFPKSNEADVENAVLSAQKAFNTWSKTEASTRSEILYKFADLLEKNVEELSFMLSAEQGKILNESKGEIYRAVKEVRFCAGEALRAQGLTLPSEKSKMWTSTIRKPIGVIAAIAPWNFPAVTPIRKIAPALAYGCTVVYKPASITPWTSVKIMDLLKQAGLPDGVVNMVIGSGSEVGEPLINHKLVKGISFTGSTEMGQHINVVAAKRLIKTQLELGGKNPAIVLEADNVSNIANQIVSAAFNTSGQRCTSISRVIVLENIKEQLVEEIIREMKKIKVGPAWDETATMGPLVNVEHLESIQKYIEIGKKEGARLLYGGEVLSDGFYSEGPYMNPAVFDQVTSDMRIAREEIFGPVLSIIEVPTISDALEIANDSEYGLASSVFSSNLSIACEYAEGLEVGMVHINHGTASAAHVPFGGAKNSGFGAFSIGYSNLEFFTELKAVYVQF